MAKRTLKNFAVSVQKSVFETFLEGPRFDEMVLKIEKFVDPTVDSVRIYGMTREAQQKMKVYGLPGLLEDPDHFVIQTQPGDGTFEEAKEIDPEGKDLEIQGTM